MYSLSQPPKIPYYMTSRVFYCRLTIYRCNAYTTCGCMLKTNLALTRACISEFKFTLLLHLSCHQTDVYYTRAFHPVPECADIAELEDSLALDQLASVSGSDVNILGTNDDGGSLRLALRGTTTVGDVKAQLAIHFLQSAQHLELHFEGVNEPLSDVLVVSSLADAASGNWDTFLVLLSEL
eukprot:scpid75448/ scgid7376/ 